MTGRKTTPDVPAARRDLLAALGCALFFAAVLLIARPWAEIPLFYDEWAYLYPAREWARTGELRLTGWSPMPLLAQAGWGALVAHLLGFSFTAMRASTMLLGAAGVAWLYALHRRAGVPTGLSALGALTVALGPLYLPLSASFMTDVPALLFTVASLHLFVVAADARAAHGDGAISRWLPALLGCAVLGAVGGSSRLSVWAAPLACLGLGAWTWRGTRAGRTCAALLLATLAALAAVLLWFRDQPHTGFGSLSELLAEMRTRPAAVAARLARSPAVGLELLFFAAPVCLAATPIRDAFRRLSRGVRMALLVAAVALPLFAATVLRHNPQSDRLLMPFTSPRALVTAWGLTYVPLTQIGDRPHAFPEWLRAVASVPFWFGLLVAAAGLVGVARRGVAPARVALRGLWDDAPLVLRLLWAVSGFYLLAAIPAVLLGLTSDRHLLPLLPALTIPLLRAQARSGSPTPRRASWAVLALLGLYATAITHDYYAEARARADAAARLMTAGVPRHRIVNGAEFDAWTETESTADPRAPVRTPGWTLPGAGWYTYWERAPHLIPEYVVSPSPRPELSPSTFAPVPYRTWLPPRRRAVVILRVESPAPSAPSAPSAPFVNSP